MEGKGQWAKCFMEPQPVIGRLWIGQGWITARCAPIKFAAIHNTATCDCAVACHVFRCGMHNQCGAVFDRAAQIRGGRCVIHDQWQTRIIRNGGHSVQIGDVTARVCDGFTENRLCIVIDCGLDCVQIIKIHKCRGPTKAFDCLAKLRDGAAI